MLKDLLKVSLLTSALVLSGCGDSEAEKALSVQQMLDKGNFEGVIAALEDNIETDGQRMQLSSAYMGAAGLSNLDLLRLISDATVETGNDTVRSLRESDDSFSVFADAIQEVERTNPEMMDFITKAIELLEGIVDNSEVSGAELMIGLAYTAKATVTLGYLGDLEALAGDVESDELKASTCMIQHTYAPDTLKDSCVVDYEGSVTIGEEVYTAINFKLDGEDSRNFKRLSQVIGGENEYIVNKNYLDNSLAEVEDGNNGVYNPNPVIVGGEPLVFTKALVDALNDGFNQLLEIAPEDTKEDVREFRREIDSNGDNHVTPEEIADYIAKKNEE